jgi:rfaE bifunctional protein kinase chain/domain
MKKEKSRLLSLIEGFPRKKIAVWGDLILDEYLFGTTRRISREAPVLILSYKDKIFSLGGGGNALMNLKSLGAEPIPFGVVGPDSSGKKIIQLLKGKKISTEYIFTEKEFKTPVKTRILAGEETAKKQQILRIDQEGKVPDTDVLKKKIRDSLKNIKDHVDGLLISDYNYDTVKQDIYDQICADFLERKVPITIDSRFRVLNFTHAAVSTPNEPEVEEALKIEIKEDNGLLNKAGKSILKKTNNQAVLITRGSKGMVLFEKGKAPFPIPIYGTTDIVDGTGAGDSVICVFLLALTAGATYREASFLANYAGSIVVMKKGTASLSHDELREVIVSEN